MANTAVVPTLDLTLTDGIHISPQGNLMIGERLARAALGMVYGHDIAWQAPDIASAQRTENGQEIELRFANVTHRMECVNPAARCFRKCRSRCSRD